MVTNVLPLKDAQHRTISAQPAAKVTSAITRMGKGNFGDNPSVGGGVRERRINFQKGYRIYFAMDGDNLVLLFWGGTKNRQQKDVDKAKQLWREYKARKRKLAKEESESANKKTKSLSQNPGSSECRVSKREL